MKKGEKRFAFGDNWSRFLNVIDDDRIIEAERSLCRWLNVGNLNGKRFLDIGSGSGLFSLAARRLGAVVHSFDYDTQSVKCSEILRNLYFNKDSNWVVEQGSVLDRIYLEKLGQFDVVYSWGVLHHTGAMWLGIDNAIQRVDDGGLLFIAIYNDQGVKSRIWWLIKYLFNKLPKPLNLIYAYGLGVGLYIANILKYTIMLRPMVAIRPIIEYKKRRGMSIYYDMKDWVGGFPFEFAQYNQLKEYIQNKGFVLVNGKMATSLGCHEMVFQKI